MKSALLVVLATAATAAVVSNDVPDVKVLCDAADVDEGPEVLLADVLELTDVIDAIEETAIDSRRTTKTNLCVGTISGSRVYNSQYMASGIPGTRIVRDITIRTNGCITKVRVTPIGPSENSTATIIQGGVGSSFVTIRIRSALGGGLNYRVEIYAG